MIRTTVSLPNDVHDELRLLAFQTKKSLNEVILEKIKGKPSSHHVDVASAHELFDLVAACNKNVDLITALREDRDRDNA